MSTDIFAARHPQIAAWSFTVGLLAACASTPVAPAPVSEGGPGALGAAPAPAALPARIPMPASLEPVERTAPKSERFVLPNGLKVVVLERPGRPVVAIRLLLGQGAASDPPDALGATYFAVALLGDLREENVREMRWERSLQRMVTDKGASYFFDVNADNAMIGIQGYSSDVNAYLEMLSEAVIKPRHGKYSFGWRRDAILDGLEELELGDDEIFFEILSRAAFGFGHVYSRSPYGNQKSLTDLVISRVTAQQRSLLNPASATLLFVGDVRASALRAEVSRRFGDWAVAKKPAVSAVPPPPVVRRKNVVLVPRSPARTMATCGVRGLADVEGDDAAVEVLAEVLGERLQAVLREKHGMTYGVSTNILRRKYARAFLVCTRLLPESTSDGLKYFRETLAAMRETAPSAEEVERAKAAVAGRIDASADDLPGLLGLYVRHLDHGESLSTAQKIAEVRGVTLERVFALGQQVLALDSLQIVLSGEQRFAANAVSANGLGKLELIHMTR